MGLVLAERIHKSAFIHEMACVDRTISVGARTRIWQFASVIRGTHLGEDCNVASSATLDGSWFGDRCIVSPGVDIGPGFLIGSDVFFGPNSVLCNDRWPSTDKEGFDAEILRSDFVTIQVKDGASIGSCAVILPGVAIGKRAMVAAGATVHVNVPNDHVFLRSGDIIRIKPEWRTRRMREAKC